MQNIKDRSKLAEAEETRFVEACKDEFIEKSLAATNAKKVKTLTAISYLPNIISGITAGFFVLFLLAGYPRYIAVILGALLLAVVGAVEVGKRGLIASLTKEYFVSRKIAGLAVVALALLIGVSMTASYQGGMQLITETGTPPPKEMNQEIPALKEQLATQQATIKSLQATTWKGKVTRDATKGIIAAKKIESGLHDRITALQMADDIAYAELLEKQTGQKLNFGYLLGILAALADMFLLGLLWTAKRLKYEVAAINYEATHTQTESHTYANPYEKAYTQNNPAALNERRPIGFRRQESEYTHAMRSQDQPETAEDEEHADTHAMRNDPKKRVKVCPICGNDFEAKTTWHKYCTEECRIAGWEKRTGKKFYKSNS